MFEHVKLLFALLLASGIFSQAHAANEALVDTARLWSTVKYTHPALADGRIDWDQALVDAMPALAGADDLPASTAAVARLMAPLGDASLRIHAAEVPALLNWPAGRPDVEWLPGAVALLHLHGGQPIELARFDKLGSARKLILDLRPATGARHRGWERSLQALLSRFIDQTVELPALRYRLASGPRPSIEGWEGLPGAFITTEADLLVPIAGSKACPMVVIVNDSEPVPKAILALQRAGRAQIVAEGATHIRSGPLQTVHMGGMTVEFSAGELVSRAGRVRVAADVVLAQDRGVGAASGPVRAALRLLGSKRRAAGTVKNEAAAFPVRRDEPEYRDMAYPALAWRRLAAIKLWAVMDRHFPAKRWMSTSWDEALATCLERMEDVRDAHEYGRALEDMAAKLDDSHVGVYSRALNLGRGKGILGVRIDHVEGRFVVTGFADTALASTGTVHIGDEVMAIDGEQFGERVSRLAPRIAASTAAGKIRKTIARVLLGPIDGIVSLDLAGADGQVRRLTLRRGAAMDEGPLRTARPSVEVLDGNVGYVDLDRLMPSEVDAMFETIKNTRAVIFDMRGYPHGVAHAIAPRLNVLAAATGAVSFQNLVTAMPLGKGVQLAFPSVFEPATAPLYRGKVIMLIDERTQSQAEDLALDLEAVAPITFVGTPSAGADGDLRQIALPGWVYVSFSGYEVTHADGAQLQRVGVTPHVHVAPTLDGIRAGRDEVLERAHAMGEQAR
ncbi:S41 family peptidase [Massilia sp. CF038]|uniref:S41 family peptidase n=1 Tax=Massilia sp. CF038 TaxID=1881045 RepID=UPI000922CAAB|nr:S41 family peptidase [Massilia sp. CF038]SHG60852.1 C-terminal processing protease CtpA/Prc, contains a PDZ domain [Massilia sp. CF038]